MNEFEVELDNLLEQTKHIQKPVGLVCLGMAQHSDTHKREKWINDVEIFFKKYHLLELHPLGDKIENLLYNKTLHTYNGLIACLESIKSDSSFIRSMGNNYFDL